MSTDEQREYLTAEEAIETLGIGRSTFYKHARALERFRRIGERRILYRVADIEAMAELQQVDRHAAAGSAVVYSAKRRRKAVPRSRGKATR